MNDMKKLCVLLVSLLLCSCTGIKTETKSDTVTTEAKSLEVYPELAAQVKKETLRSWNDYKKYAWGHDVLLPLSKGHHDWYDEPLYISPIDAYSTLRVMGLDAEAKEIEDYVTNELSWDKDIDVKVFEVNIRILGGLLSMYHYTQNPEILAKARDFADRILPAFGTETGIPTYWVNLKTGAVKGDVVNVAEAATYLFEFGILSYYTEDPKYYQAAKKATMAVFNRKSDIGLIGDNINVRSGEWTNRWSHLEAGVDAYYEYMYKSWMIFPDPEIKEVWDFSIDKIQRYLGEEFDGQYWYSIVDMDSAERVKRSVTLYDAFFPAILAVSGDIPGAERAQKAWDWLWNKYGLEPMIYNYETGEPTHPVYDLNPEIIESAYYLHQITGKPEYMTMIKQYWSDLNKYSRHEVGYASIEDVRTMEKKDYMPTFFFAETMKYFYIAFAGKETFDFDQHVFNTEAHTFSKSTFDPQEAKTRLGY